MHGKDSRRPHRQNRDPQTTPRLAQSGGAAHRLAARRRLPHPRRPPGGRSRRRAGTPLRPPPRTSSRSPSPRASPEVGEPMSLAVLPDRSVLHTSRDGAAPAHRRRRQHQGGRQPPRLPPRRGGPAGRRRRPGLRHQPVHLPLLRAAADHPGRRRPARPAPPRTSRRSTGVNRLSRFKLKTDGTLDLASEKKILDVPPTAASAATSAATSTSTPQGNLYLSTGDDTNPFDSDGYTPIDERADRNPAFDAQRSAGNTNDLRGKVLRIKVNADGSYTDPGRQPVRRRARRKTRPEIYAMGFRNPFRIERRQGRPASSTSATTAPTPAPPTRTAGPRGQVEFDRITGPGNYGWPYCTGQQHDRRPTSTTTSPPAPPAPKFDCAAPDEQLAQQHRPGRPAPGQGRLDHLRRRCGAAGVRRRRRVADGRPGLPLRRRAELADQVPAGATTATSSPASSAASWIKPITRSTRTAAAGAIDDLPVDRHAGDGHGLRPRRRALRARLRHRLVQRRRELRPVPHRVRRRRQPRADRRGARPTRPPGRRR